MGLSTYRIFANNEIELKIADNLIQNFEIGQSVGINDKELFPNHSCENDIDYDLYLNNLVGYFSNNKEFVKSTNKDDGHAISILLTYEKLYEFYIKWSSEFLKSPEKFLELFNTNDCDDNHILKEFRLLFKQITEYGSLQIFWTW